MDTNKRSLIKRVLAVVLSAFIFVTYMPGLAYAVDGVSEDKPASEEPATDNNQEEDSAGEMDGNTDLQPQEEESDAEPPVLLSDEETTETLNDVPMMQSDGTKGGEDNEEADGEKKAADITVSLTIAKTDVAVNEGVDYYAEATGTDSNKVDYIEVHPDSTGNRPYLNRSKEGKTISSRDQWLCYEEAGTYEFVAAAYAYGEDEEDDELLAESAPIEMTVSASGQAGEFLVTGVKLNGVTIANFANGINAKQGDVITIECSNAENADHYWLDIEKSTGEGVDDYEWYDHTSDSGGSTIILNALSLEEGTYRITPGANGTGYTDSYADNALTVTVEKINLPAGDMYFEVSKGDNESDPLTTCEDYSFAVYYPGASYIEVFRNYAEDRNWRSDNGGEVYTGIDSYDRSGNYILAAVAYDSTGEPLKTEQKTMYVRAESGKDGFDITMPALPPYIIENDDDGDLTFTAEKPEDADFIRAEVWFDMEDYDGDNSLFWDQTTGDSLNVTIDNSKFEKGMTVVVKVSALGYGYECADAEARIPVIGEPSDIVSITADIDAGETILVNQDIEVTVSAANDAVIESVQLYDGYHLWDDEEADEGTFTRRIGFGEPGTYSVFANVWIAGEGDESICYTTEPITIKVKKNGDAGAFDITGVKVNGATVSIDAPIEIARGSNVTLDYGTSDNADHYCVSVDALFEGDGDYWEQRDYRHYGDTSENSITFNTIELEEGSYRLRVGADAIGIQGRDADTPVYIEVTEAQVPEEGTMLFTVSKGDDPDDPLTTCEEFSFTAYCPGAEWIEVYMDDDRNREWNYDNQGGDSWYNSDMYSESGTFTIRAVAHGEENEDEGEEGGEGEDNVLAEATKTMYVRATKGDFEIKTPEGLPDYLVAGTENLSFTVERPQDANGVEINAWYDSEDDHEDLVHRRSETGNIAVEINTADFPVGAVICLRIAAWGPGYERTEKEIRIPVIDEIAEGITVDPREAVVPVNQNVEITFDAGEEKIEAIQVYDGNNYRREETLGDTPSVYRTVVSIDEQGVWNVFARVKTVGSEEWATTSSVKITTTSKGTTGNFDIIKVNGSTNYDSGVSAAQGSLVEIECSSSENANHYWVDVERYNNGNWEWEGHYADSEGPTINLGIAELTPGNYRLHVKSNGSGYETTEAEQIVSLTVNESDVGENEIAISVSKTEVETCEDIAYSAFCPAADYIKIVCSAYDEDGETIAWVEWDDRRDGTGYSDSTRFDYSGKFKLEAFAYSEDNVLIDSDSVDLTISAPNGSLVITTPDLPEDICAPNGVSFTVSKPEQASGMRVRVCYKDETDPENWNKWTTLFWAAESNNSVNVNIQPESLVIGEKMYVQIGAWGPGYEYTEATETCVDIVAHQLTPHVAKDATCTSAGNSAYWSCDVCEKLFSDSTAETETTIDAVTIPVDADAHAYGEWTNLDENQHQKVCEHNPSHIIKEAHNWGDGEETTPATETENGVKTFTCSDCGATKTEIIPSGQLVQAKQDARDELGKVNPNDYSGAEKTNVENALATAEAAIEGATTVEAVTNALNGAKTTIAAQKTDAQKNAEAAAAQAATAPAAPVEILDLPAVKISKPASAKKKLTVKWKKVSKKNLKKISGIQIQVATDPGFTNIVKTATAGKKKTSKKIGGLQPKTKYYVRIRAYGAANHYSVWKSKSAKVK